jgi:hypothetical protein
MTLTPNVLTRVIILGVLGTGIADVLNYRLIEDEGATAASTVTYLLPIVAVALGVVVLGEAAAWNSSLVPPSSSSVSHCPKVASGSRAHLASHTGTSSWSAHPELIRGPHGPALRRTRPHPRRRG